ncbi:hypothetical protein [Calidifontibacillus oryziterrae]|uniref:hypothetical protein n=1 Tax=Calidifontibacillus oryziterrae TaxID=1191699 RepID=UPI00031B1580|nr:hypothetical protein [Calidifontibacillus oryziterrae]
MKQYMIMWSIVNPPSYSKPEVTIIRTLISGESQDEAIQTWMKTRLPLFSVSPHQVKIHHVQEWAS